jgi:hypothetical protein
MCPKGGFHNWNAKRWGTWHFPCYACDNTFIIYNTMGIKPIVERMDIYGIKIAVMT